MAAGKNEEVKQGVVETPERDDRTIPEIKKDVPAISAKTITNTIIMAVTLVNSLAIMLGIDLGLKIDENTLYQVISAALVLYSTISVWWYNNDFTVEARRRRQEQEEKEGK